MAKYVVICRDIIDLFKLWLSCICALCALSKSKSIWQFYIYFIDIYFDIYTYTYTYIILILVFIFILIFIFIFPRMRRGNTLSCVCLRVCLSHSGSYFWDSWPKNFIFGIYAGASPEYLGQVCQVCRLRSSVTEANSVSVFPVCGWSVINLILKKFKIIF